MLQELATLFKISDGIVNVTWASNTVQLLGKIYRRMYPSAKRWNYLTENKTETWEKSSLESLLKMIEGSIIFLHHIAIVNEW